MNKAERIKQTLKDTKERRKKQVCKIFELKLQNLSKDDIELLDRLFLETKWFYNYIITDIKNRLKYESYKLSEVDIKTPNGFEKRQLDHLSSQMKQGILDRIKQNLINLKKAKEKGIKVGKLKFKTEMNSIPLKQYGNTYKLIIEHNKLKLQRIKKKFRILGLRQIPDNVEFANATLIKKPSGFYLHVVCFIDKDEIQRKTKDRINKQIGVDFGIKKQITLSNGMALKWKIPESKRLKKLQRSFSKKEKRSKNWFKLRFKIRKEYENITNKRKDIQNRVFSFLGQYDLVAIQNENIKGWHSGLFGKQVQNAGMGGIISRLKNLETLVLVDRYLPTTKTCSNCGQILNVSLLDRIIKCDCGFVIDRDVNAAINILKFAVEKTTLKILPVDCGEVTPVERKASARILEHNPNIRVSYALLKQEAQLF